ncbi:hypothetical protein [Sulfurimonas sp.]|uniref:hypothetical protein n=1 Tax=Sulfurimonas sp. TaxID=2022749 RepID=UPI00356A2D58
MKIKIYENDYLELYVHLDDRVKGKKEYKSFNNLGVMFPKNESKDLDVAILEGFSIFDLKGALSSFISKQFPKTQKNKMLKFDGFEAKIAQTNKVYSLKLYFSKNIYIPDQGRHNMEITLFLSLLECNIFHSKLNKILHECSFVH